MKSVRQKWASHKTYRKIQRAWQEYTGVVDKRHVHIPAHETLVSSFVRFVRPFGKEVVVVDMANP